MNPKDESGPEQGGNTPPNPVAQARLQVEAVVPLSKRGPGWDRHWRELEAYVEQPGEWTVPNEGQEPPAD